MIRKIGITDTTFRDAHQSLMSTRMKTEDILAIASKVDDIGFHSAEVWGGATFDSAIRFLNEDPWERLEKIKDLMPKTPLQMLLRGQSLVGYRAYSDDVVDQFISSAASTGIDIFRVFDALNDEFNLTRAAEAVKKSGKHLQMTLVYSVSDDDGLNGNIYNLDYYLEKAKSFQKMNADSLCIKDMAGLLSPYDAYELVSHLKSNVDIPIQLHSHCTSGMAPITYLKAIEAGVDVIDTAISPLSMGTSQPALESIVASLRNSEYEFSVNDKLFNEFSDYIESILPKYEKYFSNQISSRVDAGVLSHQIPGGMISNLVSQLSEMNELDKLPKVLKEIPNVRKLLGYPALVTPISQMVAAQSVNNVVFGKDKLINSQVKDYVYGLYGRPPAPVDSKYISIALKDYPQGNNPISSRPADLLAAELDQAAEEIKDLSSDVKDILIHTLFPNISRKFLDIKFGHIQVESEDSDNTEKKIDANDSVAVEPNKNNLNSDEIPTRSDQIRSFNVFVEDQYFKVDVDPINKNFKSIEKIEQPNSGKPKNKAVKSNRAKENTLIAPMAGTFLRYEVEVGQEIKSGDSVLVIESMKMENSIPALADSVVAELPFKPGDAISKGDILIKWE
ncbi:MAG: pyruvate carboxylase subunit B [SAR202 cluster bacterium]|nr:pyruvate carboxylase subunit B [SAR202 cluster bacterium]